MPSLPSGDMAEHSVRRVPARLARSKCCGAAESFIDPDEATSMPVLSEGRCEQAFEPISGHDLPSG